MNERLSLCMTPTRSHSRRFFWGANVPTEPCRRRKTYPCSFCRLAKPPPKFQFFRSIPFSLRPTQPRAASAKRTHPTETLLISLPEQTASFHKAPKHTRTEMKDGLVALLTWPFVERF